MTASAQDIVSQINHGLNPCAVIEAIGYRSHRMKVLGTMIRTPCPLHDDRGPGTLIIVPGRNTYKCMCKTCRGYEGGTLVDLWGQYKAMGDPSQAAADLARTLGMPVTEEDLAQVPRRIWEALSQGRTEEGRQLAEQARKKSPDSPTAAHALAHLFAHQSRREEARRSYLEAARGYQEQGRYEVARKVLEENVLAADPDDEEALRELADVLEVLQDRSAAADALLRLNRLLNASGRTAEGRQLLMRRLPDDVLAKDPELRIARAEALRDADRLEEAGEQLLAAAEAYIIRREGEKAQATLRTIPAAAFPNPHRIRELFRFLGRENEAIPLLIDAGEQAGKRSQWDAQESYATHALELVPDLFEGLCLLAQALAGRGCHGESMGTWERIYQQARNAGRDDDAEAALWHLSGLPGGATATRRLLEETLTPADAAEKLLELAHRRYDAGSEEQAVAVAEESARVRDTGAGSRERVANLLAGHGHYGAAARHFLSAARLHLERARPADSLRAVERVLAQDPTNFEALRLRIQVELAQGNTNSAMETLEMLAALHAERQEAAQQEEALREILALDPGHLGALRALTRLLGKQADTDSRRHEALLVCEALARRFRDMGDLPGQVEVLEDQLRLEPDAHETREELAVLLRQMGRLRQAVGHYLQVARSCSGASQYPRALQFYTTVLELSPGEEEALRGMLNAARQVHDSSTVIDAAVRLSLVYHEEGRAAEAEAVLREAMEAAPSSPVPKLRLAMLQEERGNLGEAATLRCETALALLIKGRREEAHSEALEAFRLHLADGHPEAAEKCLDDHCRRTEDARRVRRRAAALCDRHGIPELGARQLLLVIREAMAADDWNEALSLAREAVVAAPRSIEARDCMATILEHLGRGAEAANHLVELADALGENDRLDRVIAVLERATRNRPEDSALQRRLAQALERFGNAEQAAETWSALSQKARAGEEWAEAVEALQSVVRLRPTDVAARQTLVELRTRLSQSGPLIAELSDLAAIYERQGQREAAVGLYRRILRLEPGHDGARLALADHLLAQGRPGEAARVVIDGARLNLESDQPTVALDLLRAAPPVAEKDPDYHVLLADANAALMQDQQAIVHLKDAALLFEGAQQWERQLQVLQRILRLDPKETGVQRDVIELLSRVGNRDEARQQRILLAQALAERGQGQRAEEELRAILAEDATHWEAWDALLGIVARRGSATELAAELRKAAKQADAVKESPRALGYYERLRTLAPADFDARRRYVDLYREVGPDEDLVDDYLALANSAIAAGRMEEGIELYGRVMALDPNQKTGTNGGVNDVKTQMEVEPASDETRAPQWLAREEDQETQERPLNLHAQQFLLSAAAQLDSSDEVPTLSNVIQNYRDILSINSQNAQVRIKLADLLLQLGSQEEALREMETASETFLMRQDLDACIMVCERILNLAGDRAAVQQRLKVAYQRREAMKALESAILFSDRQNPPNQVLR